LKGRVSSVGFRKWEVKTHYNTQYKKLGGKW
jgi:hypothetical protein